MDNTFQDLVADAAEALEKVHGYKGVGLDETLEAVVELGGYVERMVAATKDALAEQRAEKNV